MKISIFCSLFAFLLLTGISCKKEKDTCTPNILNLSINPNRNPSTGVYLGDQDLNFYINDFKDHLATKGATEATIKSFKVTKVQAVNPFGLTFADFSAIDVLIDGQKIATLPTGATGKSLDFNLTSDIDVKPIYFRPSSSGTVFLHKASFNAVTNKSVSSSSTIGFYVYVEACY